MAKKRITDIRVGKYLAQPQYFIEFIIDDNCENGEDLSRTIILPPGIPTRDETIDAIITDEYHNDRMQAVQNNYLLDPLDEEAKAEMDEMQAWRKMAKEIADEFIEYLNEKNN